MLATLSNRKLLDILGHQQQLVTLDNHQTMPQICPTLRRPLDTCHLRPLRKHQATCQRKVATSNHPLASLASTCLHCPLEDTHPQHSPARKHQLHLQPNFTARHIGRLASSPDDDLSKFICTECLRQIMRHGNLSYNLWSTLDYLMKMHAEEVMDVTSFDIPADSLDFLFSREMDCSLQPLVLEKKNQPYASRVSSCGNKDRGSVARTFMTEKAGSEMEEKEKLPKVEFCWCNECNEEFITREDLRLHTKKHAETGTRDGFEQNEDLILSSEEYKLLSGEVSLLKNKLCCSKCQKEFKSEKKLVRHVKKYDFQCEHRSFVNLNNHLKSLKSNRAEDSALMNTQGKDGTFHVNYKLCEATSPLTRDLSDNSNGDLVNNKYISDNGVEAGVSDVSYKVKQRKFHEKLPSHVGSLPSMNLDFINSATLRIRNTAAQSVERGLWSSGTTEPMFVFANLENSCMNVVYVGKDL
ncbi:uncharacterized protein LOC124172740 isoform X14 [Ischnura elegans]|uniref:uncharacterized protein LOC124172740 isoform X14 n=1 Tax=Ischnura elegans TaxID=197161 RepID=UPI001ED87155|nr:uncharacterized protein LOC124172740 isoform X14 [Ischnura elegans]